LAERRLSPKWELMADVISLRWSYAGGVIKVEPKADIIKRLGRSPDLSDATVYSILVPPHRPRRGPAGFYL
jgi:hypothetical protein